MACLFKRAAALSLKNSISSYSSNPLSNAFMSKASLSSFTRSINSSADSDSSFKSESLKSDSLKSPDDFTMSNVYAGGLTFFGESGMAIVRVGPALYKKEGEKYMTNSDGCLWLQFIPRSDSQINKFDSAASIKFRIRGIDVGHLLEINPSKLSSTPVVVPGGGGIVEFTSGENNQVLMTARPSKRDTSYESRVAVSVTVEITTGQLKTLQSVLLNVSPCLFGLQVLTDPRLVHNFLDAKVLRTQRDTEEMKRRQTASSEFFDSDEEEEKEEKEENDGETRSM